MTNENKTLVAPSDIQALGFECPRCNATYFVPLQKLDQIVRSCPNCRESWIDDAPVPGKPQSDMQVVFLFATCLKELQTRSFGTQMRFVIAPESSVEVSK